MEGYQFAAERPELTADAEALDEVLVPFRVAALQVIQQTTPASDHRQQPTTGMMIFLVRLEVLRELEYTLAQDSYLNLWRPAVVLVSPILRNNAFSNFERQCHSRMETPRLS